MKTFKQFTEELISPSAEPNTMSFYHGGQLDYGFEDTVNHKKGRFEYGPGLYLITRYATAATYAKGSRKLYLVTVKKGTDIEDIIISKDIVLDWLNKNLSSNKKNLVLKYIENRFPTPAYILNNIMINHDILTSKNSNSFRKFLVENGIDYSIVNSPFGWTHSKMLVVFNFKKIVSVKKITPKDKVEYYDLPTEWT